MTDDLLSAVQELLKKHKLRIGEVNKEIRKLDAQREIYCDRRTQFFNRIDELQEIVDSFPTTVVGSVCADVVTTSTGVLDD